MRIKMRRKVGDGVGVRECYEGRELGQGGRCSYKVGKGWRVSIK